MTQSIRVFAGIEGGGTKTCLSIIDEHGNVLTQATAGPSNPWLLGNSDQDGFKIAANLLNCLILNSLNKIQLNNLNSNSIYKLEAATLCLSGGGSKKAQDRLMEEFKNLNLDFKILIANDSLAPLFTASQKGGIVLIAGTGSYCVLVNPVRGSLSSLEELEIYTAGGWGNFLGDEGSGFWITKKLIKYLISVNDNFTNLLDNEQLLEYNQLKELVLEHFQIKSIRDILPHFYENRRIDQIARLTEFLAKISKGKKVLLDIFDEAGFELAKHVLALRPKINQGLIDESQGLPIICTGSVFECWPLLKAGFVRCLRNQHANFKCIKKFNLLRLNENSSSSLGAALLGAKLCSLEVKLDLVDLVGNLDRINLDE